MLPPYGSRIPPVNPMVVSIAPIEAAALAGRFPIAWRKDEAGWDLVCLCGLSPDHDALAPTEKEEMSGAAEPGRSLPILISAWPLTVIDDGSATGLGLLRDTATDWLRLRSHRDLGEDRGLDEESAEDPEEEAFNESGEPSLAFERRTTALWIFVQSRRRMAPFFAEMDKAGAFLPWDVDLRRVGLPADIRGLYYLSADYFETISWPEILAHAGISLASLGVAHRISLFRLQAMLASIERNS